MNRAFLLLPLLLAACAGCKEEPSKPGRHEDTADTGDTGTDSGLDTDSGTTEPPCEHSFVKSEPLSGNQKWYYRDPIEITFDAAAAEDLASLTMQNAAGEDVALSITWADNIATITTLGGLWVANEDYTLTVDICEETTEILFGITEYGDPMTAAPSELVGRTYYIDMSMAQYSEPPGIGGLLSLKLSEPLLISVTAASEDSIEVLGAQGKVNESTGEISQDTSYLTWPFGVADFTSAPFFSAVSTSTVFDVGEEIPVYDFQFEGTFSPDGARIGGAQVRGLGDTRNMGPLLNLGDDPNAVCTLLGDIGLSCEQCPDGNPYCLTIAATFEDAVWLEGVTLEPVVE